MSDRGVAPQQSERGATVALGTFIAGAYTGTLNSVALGIMENGYELQVDQKSRLINRSDQYADTLMDFLVSGCDWHLQSDGLEYKTGTTNALGQIATLGLLGVIGRLGSDIAQSLVLTATAGTPAATTPATLTATKAVLAENFNSRLLFSSELRKVPLRWTLLPYDSSGIKFWTST